MEDKKILIVQSCPSGGGMEEYSKIFQYGYGAKSKNVILFKDHYWLTAIMIFFGLHRRKIAQWCKFADTFDVVHFTSNAIFDFLLINSFLKRTSCKIIYTLHDPRPHKERILVRKLIRYLSFQINNYLLAKEDEQFYVHVHSLALLPEKFKNKMRVFALPHPLSIVNKDVEDIFSIKKTSLMTFSYVGRVEYYKGIDKLLDAIKELDKKGKYKFNVIIAGKGREKLILPKTNLITITRIDRYLSNEEFDSIIKYSSAIVLPYREATASGVLTRVIPFNTPVLCTAVGCMKEYVEDGVNGKIIYNINDLPEAIGNFAEEYIEQNFPDFSHKHPLSPTNCADILIKNIFS